MPPSPSYWPPYDRLNPHPSTVKVRGLSVRGRGGGISECVVARGWGRGKKMQGGVEEEEWMRRGDENAMQPASKLERSSYRLFYAFIV